MTEVVINRCYGGFGLSKDAVLRARELSGDPKWGDVTLPGEKYEGTETVVPDWYNSFNVYIDGDFDTIKTRTNSILIAVVKELGTKANGEHSELAIVNVPEGVDWFIDDYDGVEEVHETHRSWS